MGLTIEEGIRTMAGALVRSQHPRRAFARAAQEAGGGRGGRIFDWAIGWPAREDKIVINARRRNFGIRLK